MKPKYYCLLCFAVLACAVIGIVIRLSFVPNGYGTESYRFGPWPVNAETVFSNNNLKVTSIDDLIQYSDVVIKCRYTGGMTISDSEYFFPVIVEEVFKGSDVLVNSNIIVEEGIATFVKEKYINSYGGLFPLKQNEDYVMLLKKENVSNYFDAKDIRSIKYKLLTNTPFGIYRVSGLNAAIVPTLDTSFNYKSYIKTYEFLVDSQSTLDKFSLLRNQLLKKFVEK